MKKAYFQYYETFENIVQKFATVEEQHAFRTKIINYGLYGKEPDELTPTEAFVWDLVKDVIDDQMHRREINKANRAMRKAAKDQAPAPEPYSIEPIKIPLGDLPPDRDEKPKAAKFQRPTVEDVAKYCTERKNEISAQQFWDYYEARGWKIGKNSMKDWKAAVRTWEQRRTTEAPNYGTAYQWPEEKLTL